MPYRVGVSLPEVERIDGFRLLAKPSGRPVATATAIREADGQRVLVALVVADLDAAALRRVRAECGRLEAIVTGIDPAVVLPLLDHGVDDRGRPWLAAAFPGPDLEQMLAENGTLPVPTVVAAAQAAAEGLKALAANGIVGSPPSLFALPAGGVTMGPPLPPALAELEATQGGGSGHEPPEVLGGADWTPAAQVYACASIFWTLLCGQKPFEDPLARLAAVDPPELRRADVPEQVVAILRQALSAEPGSRQPTPADLATALRDAAARRLGSLYLLDRRIGKGGCGEVWAGRRKASEGEPVAVKLLHPDLVEAELGRFVREYHILHQLRHPQLVRVDEFFSEGGVFAIVMDLVRGGNLRQFAAQNTLTLTEAASLLAQTADGLAAVHEAGLVHRDIKPENVLVAEREQRPVALLSDFGIARPLRDSEHTQVLGTPSYLAPELAMGRAPSQASDIYALGVMAYEILAGHKPFQGDNVDALLLAHIDKVPARPEGLPDQAWQLIAACLDKDPQARPTAAKAAAAWKAIAGSRQIQGQTHEDEVTILSAHPAGPEPKQQPAPRKKRRLILAVIAAVIIGLATGVYLATRQSPTSTTPANQQFQYPVAATVAAEGTVAVVSWHSDAATMPGFQGYLVFDVTGDRPRALTATMLGADATTFQVDGLRPGRRTCFYVIAVGVTVSPPQQTPPLPCVTPPTAKPTTP